eukprot:COSAG05_NODE_15736_length_362_cov_1.372624_1_plen_74_part_01
MWLAFDLGEIYTIAGLRYRAHASGGLPEHCTLQVSGSNHSWEAVSSFRGAPTSMAQDFLGFEGSGRFWRLLSTS